MKLEQYEQLTDTHMHCWHQVQGPIWIVLQDGETVQKCCACPKTRIIHREHA